MKSESSFPVFEVFFVGVFVVAFAIVLLLGLEVLGDRSIGNEECEYVLDVVCDFGYEAMGSPPGECEHHPSTQETVTQKVLDKWTDVSGGTYGGVGGVSTTYYISIENGYAEVSRDTYGTVHEGDVVSVTIKMSDFYTCNGRLGDRALREFSPHSEPTKEIIIHW